MLISHEVIKRELEGTAEAQMEKLFKEVPFARDFHAGRQTNLSYFRRHLLETFLRMRLDIQTDAYALYEMRHSNSGVSKLFAQYLVDESGHDVLFLADIEQFGISREEALSAKPFAATEDLIGYFYYQINHEGPLLTVLWSWFVEWYSERFNGSITRKAASEFGADKLKGSTAHLKIDAQEEHDDLMLRAVAQLIRTEDDLTRATTLLFRLVNFLRRYFQELYDTTIGRQTEAA
jgi:Iron-containing redox enzyme